MRLLIFARPLLTLFVFFFSSIALDAQTTVFTYQGRLTDASMPASGTYDLQFTLYDASGTPIGATTARDDVTVTNGVFTVQLDFGAAAFPGANRVIEIAVRRGAETGAYTTLSPRQPVTSAPYAIRALNAGLADSATNATTATTATNAQNLGGAAANQFVQTNSAAFIRNQTTPQTAANFNIDGTGAAGIFNAQTQYNILGSRVLSAVGFGNLIVGVGAGNVNTGSFNAFVGSGTGQANTTGGNNSFVGSYAGYRNTTGYDNSFVGANAGYANTTGHDNSFFGTSAGSSNTGNNNSFVGSYAGISNTSGIENSFFGTSAGRLNTTGFYNSFVGFNAGYSNTTGYGNSFVGKNAGYSNTTGANNLFVGLSAGNENTTGSGNSFVGSSAGYSNITGYNNLFVGEGAGYQNTAGNNNAFVGKSAGTTNTTGDYNTIIGTFANVSSGDLDHATAIGANAYVNASNTIVLGRTNGLDKVVIYGLGAAGSTTLCRNAALQISTCSSSLRYKTNIASFGFGLNVVNRLRPISFDWKDGGMKDVGFGAEDVAQINPLLVTYNEKGEVEGVKYDRLSVVFVNAFKEQQTQIEKQITQIESQQRQINELKKVVCALQPQAEMCRP